MKYLKYILLLVISLALFPEVFAQQLTQTYPGTWNYQNGNQVFVVKIWQDGNTFKGHYKMTVINSGTTIYNSRRQFGDGIFFPPTIVGYANTQNGLSGSICDNTILGYTEDCLEGNFQMKIIPFLPGCTSCVVTATWKVSDTPGMKVGQDPPFSVPTNITLTKVSDQVVWDD